MTTSAWRMALSSSSLYQSSTRIPPGASMRERRAPASMLSRETRTTRRAEPLGSGTGGRAEGAGGGTGMRSGLPERAWLPAPGRAREGGC
jgi:hypothetical protein